MRGRPRQASGMCTHGVRRARACGPASRDQPDAPWCGWQSFAPCGVPVAPHPPPPPAPAPYPPLFYLSLTYVLARARACSFLTMECLPTFFPFPCRARVLDLISPGDFEKYFMYIVPCLLFGECAPPPCEIAPEARARATAVARHRYLATTVVPPPPCHLGHPLGPAAFFA